jgi:hypothetical protein
MLRPIGLGLALAIGATAAPAFAASYSANLEQPATGRFIASGISWQCGGATCAGATTESRPLVLCQGLAKQAGRIGSFTVNGRPLAADQLERCNASAKAAKTSELANR